jgi:hypothetical protein
MGPRRPPQADPREAGRRDGGLDLHDDVGIEQVGRAVVDLEHAVDAPLAPVAAVAMAHPHRVVLPFLGLTVGAALPW